MSLVAVSAQAVPMVSPLVVTQLKQQFDYAVPLTTETNWSITALLPKIRDARAWCLERFGVSATMSDAGTEQIIVIDMNRSWASYGQTFLFKDADAAFEFKMRWV